MANLVAPVNMLPKSVERIIDFRGLNRRDVVSEGELSDMQNLTSDNYPVLTPRKPRGRMRLPAGVVRPLRIISKFEKIALIARTDEDISFYYDGNKISEVDNLSEATVMVSINTKLCFFPEKTYLEIANDGTVGEYGSLESEVSVVGASMTASSLDYCRITLTDNPGFKYDDAISIKGSITYTKDTQKTVECDVSVAVEDIENDNTLVLPQGTFLGIVEDGATNITLTGTISRTMPTLDHVVEWNNRLWGCNSADNTIYASKLGDPTNWQYFQGTGLDSYYAQQGTDGAWTGIGLYSSHLVFFKENSMSRVYGSAPSNYQVSNTEVFGVESGSRQSIVTINDTIFYKSKIGIMAYSGGVPECISDGFNCEFANVVAGTEKRKYYASIQTKGKGYELMVFDTEKGFWHKEDNTRFRSCTTIGDKLYYIQYEGDELTCSVNLLCSSWLLIGSDNIAGQIGIINPNNPEEDVNSIEWKAVFGPFDEYIEEHKIYSKLALRVIAADETDNSLTDEMDSPILTEGGEPLEIPRSVKVYISIDEGDWELVENYEPPRTKGDFIPIIPRRCDRYSVMITGKGTYKIKSLTRRVRQGSFGRL